MSSGPQKVDTLNRRYGNADARAFSRRKFFRGVAIAVALSFPFARRLSEPYFQLFDKLGAPEAVHIFQQMFGTSHPDRSSALLLGRSDYQAKLHPDNFAAGAALLDPLGYRTADGRRQGVLDAARRDELTMIGGTNSNITTMIAWEASGPDIDHLSRPEERGETALIPLRWFGSSDRESDEVLQNRRVGWQMEGQGFVSTVNWLLRDTVTGASTGAQSAGTSVKDKNDNWTLPLTTNHLLLTRLPNFLHPDFLSFDRENWPYMMFFQGMHGLGTRAVELLLTGEGLPALQAAQRAVQGHTAYQLLFEVGDVRRLNDGRGGELDVCHGIHLVDHYIIDERVHAVTYGNAHESAQARLRSPTPWLL